MVETKEDTLLDKASDMVKRGVETVKEVTGATKNFNYDYDKTMTNQFGIPVTDDNNSWTFGSPGPILIQDFQLLHKLQHFNRERIPERVVHAMGSGAYGTFKVTHDISQYTKAEFLNGVGKETPLFIRFSNVSSDRGSPDVVRDVRGFSIKFYTREGNNDWVFNNTPLFFIRDSYQFVDFIHTQKRHPVTNLSKHTYPQTNAQWDFWSKVPESIHQVTQLFSDRGTPYSHRHINGYSGHAYKFVNKDGEAVWVKIHIKTDQGIKNLTDDESRILAGRDPDHQTRDLFEAIDRGEFPSWTCYLQVMTLDQANTYPHDPFDITKVWYHKDFPLIPFGKIVLNKNPDNYFQEVEQSAFAPSTMVPGIEPSPDKVLQSRMFGYHDAHLYRLGVNYHQIPVNSAKRAQVNTISFRDGLMCTSNNQPFVENYQPNRNKNAPTDQPEQLKNHPTNGIDLKKWNCDISQEGELLRRQQHKKDDDFIQCRKMFAEVFNDGERERLAYNIACSLGLADEDLQKEMLKVFYKVHEQYGQMVEKELEKGKKKREAAMSKNDPIYKETKGGDKEKVAHTFHPTMSNLHPSDAK